MRIMSRDDATSAPAGRANKFSRVRADAKPAPSVVHECDGLDSIANLVERIEGLVFATRATNYLFG
jgi:hypothetical protein